MVATLERIAEPKGFIFDPSLVLYLPLYELEGASFMSQDAYGHLCTVTGAMWGLQGRYFDGSDDIIDCGSILTLGEHTFLWWMKSSHSSGNGGVFGFRGTPAGEGLSIVGTVPYLILHWMGNRVIFADVASYLDGNWHLWEIYIAGSGQDDIDNAALKIDGTAIAQDTVTKTSAPNAWGDLLICGNGGYARFDATMGDILFYTRKLSPLESQNIYLATKWRYR